MNGQIKSALAATVTVVVIMVVAVVRTLRWTAPPGESLSGALPLVGCFAFVTALGLSIGWWRFFRDRRERRNRPKPLDLG